MFHLMMVATLAHVRNLQRQCPTTPFPDRLLHEALVATICHARGQCGPHSNLK
jgi:hypothetical protein